MQWTPLTSESQLEEIDKASHSEFIIVFKHSTRCNISETALERLNRKADTIKASADKTYYLDILTYRNLSDALAKKYNVVHESPQLMLIHKGQCIFHASHLNIDPEAVANLIEDLKQSN
ncbi:MAG: bacillithiol system redox-active protein YtxJ [Cytophagaceae bacterium]|nr:bacillithiol system redox-active protein YtxJ [Cytophagaceae bacterium]MDW8455727.1 bacillithiol system redox-active protein YtxJ [Cytophagaceae bacterium]